MATSNNPTKAPGPGPGATGGIMPIAPPTHAPGRLPTAKPMPPQLTPPKPAQQVPRQNSPTPAPKNQPKMPNVKLLPLTVTPKNTAKTQTRGK